MLAFNYCPSFTSSLRLCEYSIYASLYPTVFWLTDNTPISVWCLSVYLSMYLSIDRSINLSAYLCIYLSICLSIYRSIYPSSANETSSPVCQVNMLGPLLSLQRANANDVLFRRGLNSYPGQYHTRIKHNWILMII